MSDNAAQRSNPGSGHHPVRDAVISAALIVGVTQSTLGTGPVSSEQSTGREPPLALSEDVKMLIHEKEVEREQRQESMFDVAQALQPPEYVDERKRDTRSER